MFMLLCSYVLCCYDGMFTLDIKHSTWHKTLNIFWFSWPFRYVVMSQVWTRPYFHFPANFASYVLRIYLCGTHSEPGLPMVSGAFNNYQKLPFKIAKIKSSLCPRPEILTVFSPIVPEKENKSQKKKLCGQAWTIRPRARNLSRD